ncbi:hypothetical protein WJX74_003623 [Apatococcus lobatus]|uniref:Uncharacterized protein n=1 Tax=Apatococcus lobatus TaxID=904363 RepID=A0AAW1QT83_9CHLO
MIFPQGWQVQVLKPSGAGSYADLSHGTDRYVVGLPGNPFEVQVTAPAAMFRSAPTLRVCLTIDGQSVGVSKILSESHPSTVFEGFVNTVKGEQRYSQFLFGKPQDAPQSSGAGSSRDKNTGGLEISIEHVQSSGHHVSLPKHTSNPAAGASKPVEGKKWFMRPSLKADSGDIVGKPFTFSTTRYDKVRHLATLSLRMETAAILTLRKVLNPKLPAHQAIINASTAAMRTEQIASSAPGQPSAVLGSGDIPRDAVRNQASSAGPSRPGTAVSSKPAGIKRNVKSEMVDLSCRPSAKVPKIEPGLPSQGFFANAEPELIDLT